MKFIDSHTHVDFPEFDEDRIDALVRAKQSGVEKIILSATVAKGWKSIETLAENHSIIAPAYGLHPMFMAEHQAHHLEQLQDYLGKKKPIAIGEIGLDFFISNPDKHAQLDLFCTQLDLAVEYNLPVIIHARKSLDLVLRELRKRPQVHGSIHSFSGSEQQARQLIDLGFYLGFGGPITYTRATKLRRLVSVLPLESILLETDAPDQPDAKHFGMRNEPAYLSFIANEIADIRNISLEEVAEQTLRNTKTLFEL